MGMYICSSAAHEYWGNQRELSLKYAHLDLAIIEVKNFDAVTGLLPELWGMRPMSEFTKAHVKKTGAEAAEAALPSIASETTDGRKIAWAGGIGMQDAGCLDDSDNNATTEVEV